MLYFKTRKAARTFAAKRAKYAAHDCGAKAALGKRWAVCVL